LTQKGQRGQKVRKMMMVGAFFVDDLIFIGQKGQKVRRFSSSSWIRGGFIDEKS
jgi:hypothetical protein